MDTLLSIWPTIPLDATILELGCNLGRQTYRLQTLGYTALTRAEINPTALYTQSFRHESTPVEVDLEAEDWGVLDSRQWDVVFTVAVLEHIYSDRVLDKMARIASKWICVCEDEVHESETHHARDYRKEFESRGWVQVSAVRVKEDEAFWARVFSRST